jgi:glycine/D-amino acid oxidase-like deaminating enzyme
VPGTRYGVSPWIDGIPLKKRPAFPAYRGEEEVPLVIIGGGLTGAMTAYAAAAAGIKVLLLDANRVGQGGSGHASGICAGEAAPSFVALEDAAGRRLARVQFDAMRRAVLDLGTTVKRLSLKADFQAGDAVRLVSPGTAEKSLLKELDRRREAGLDMTWLKTAAVRTATRVDADAGARVSPWATCDPYRLLLGFLKAATARRARVFEQTPVTRITFDRVRATLTTPHGRIVSACVVHATGEPTSLVTALKRHFRWEARSCALSEPLPPAVRKAIGPPKATVYDTDVPPHIIRWTADHRVLVSGADGARPKPALAAKHVVQRTGQLMYELTRLYPDISGVLPAYGWTTPLAHSVDGGLFVGPHRNFPHQLFAFGTAHDPARAFLASRILLRHVQKATTKDDDQFGFARAL